MTHHLKSVHMDVFSQSPVRPLSIFFSNREWVIERLGISIYFRYLADWNPNATLISFAASLFWHDNAILSDVIMHLMQCDQQLIGILWYFEIYCIVRLKSLVSIL